MTGRKTFHGYLKQIDGMLAGREWLSDRYSVLDPYGLVFYSWGVRRELPMAELSNYTAFKDRMLKRPAVARVVENEKIDAVLPGGNGRPRDADAALGAYPAFDAARVLGNNGGHKAEGGEQKTKAKPGDFLVEYSNSEHEVLKQEPFFAGLPPHH